MCFAECLRAQEAIILADFRDPLEHPWIFSVNMYDPHHRFNPPEEYFTRYLDCIDDTSRPDYVEKERENKSRWQKINHDNAHGDGRGFAFDS